VEELYMVLSAMPLQNSTAYTQVACWQGSSTKRIQKGQQEEPLYILQPCTLPFHLQGNCQHAKAAEATSGMNLAVLCRTFQ